VAATIGALNNMQQAQAKARVAGIDKEIDAEKKRDGKSKESIAKIAALEKKKDAVKRKAFEQDKKMKMAQVVMSTAAAIMQTLATGGAFAMPLVGLVAAMGAMQLSAIASSSYEGGAASTGAGAPSSISIGERQSSVDVAKSRSTAGEIAYMRGESGTGGPETFKPTGGAFYGRKMRAAGGETAGYMVGEQGPELFVPDRPGTVVPSDDTQAMGGGSNVSFTINAVDAEGVEQVLMKQQGNIISMLRNAANSYGEPFMEGVDTTTFTPAQQITTSKR